MMKTAFKIAAALAASAALQLGMLGCSRENRTGTGSSATSQTPSTEGTGLSPYGGGPQARDAGFLGAQPTASGAPYGGGPSAGRDAAATGPMYREAPKMRDAGATPQAPRTPSNGFGE
jgi:hypothetical protein